MTRRGNVHFPSGIMVMPISRAASVIVLAPTFMPYEAHTITRSSGPRPWETKIRAYFSAYRCQSSQVRKKALGLPLVPDVSWRVKTSFHATLLNWKSAVSGGWFSRNVLPDIMGNSLRSSCVRTSEGSIPCSLNHAL